MSVLLCILDGFGVNENQHGNAIKQANTPNIDKLFANNPVAELFTHGKYVGLPEDQMGNSEVGHMTIGSGRLILQTLPKIDDALATGSLFTKSEYTGFMEKSKDSNAIHLLGLVSAGGVHSHVNHIVGLAKKLNEEGKKVFIHAITDGRDVAPNSGKQIIADLQAEIADLENVELADMIGRFYAMDRDNRAERTDAAYELYTLRKDTFIDSDKFAKGTAEGKYDKDMNPVESLNEIFDKDETIAKLDLRSTDEIFDASYANEVYDEFLPATKLAADSEIQAGDTVIFANFRADRARQMTAKLIDCGLNLHIATLTEFDAKFNDDVTVFFGPEDITNTIGEVVANAGLSQLRIAETEKYAHVTFFMNGGKEEPFESEERVLIPSPKVATYDLQPEMSLDHLTSALTTELAKGHDMIICNVANGDMVGHTGSMEAAIKAVEAIDEFVGKILPELEARGYDMLLTADHGNCEEMLDENNNVLTKHSKNPVPVCYFGSKDVKLKNGGLADLAPTILHLMNLEIPDEMSGSVLIEQ